ncbi:hypothetical protein AMTRI_Chr03g146060 [Amborella trichopoda]
MVVHLNEHLSSLDIQQEGEAELVSSSSSSEEEEEDEEEEQEEEEAENVTLGFVEKRKNPRTLQRQFFPSKAGGQPAWLEPDNLPTGDSCICDICGGPLQFLLQVYAPISEYEYTFHRTLFVFMCPSMTCLVKDQLEQKNAKSGKIARRYLLFFRSKLLSTLCTWCGTWKGNKICSGCKQANYCSEKHQMIHWRGGHNNDCNKTGASPQSVGCSSRCKTSSKASPIVSNKVASASQWPEYEIINEDESAFFMEDMEAKGLETSLVSQNHMDGALQSLVDKFVGSNDRESWASFQSRIALAPEQVMRYCREVDSKPLWPSLNSRPMDADIPTCEHCGSRRGFEFQVLPQLLYYFHVKNDDDSIDWATIVIHTCGSSCDTGPTYKEEFAWVQLCSTP